MKKILSFIIILITTVFACGCDGDRSVILFNKHPITEETIVSNSNTNVFATNDRIYYLITLPEPIETKFLRIQIVKVGGGKDERLGYELVWGKKVKLRDENVHFYTDYVVFSEPGAYIMKVYSRDNPEKILTTGNFYVRD